MIKSNDQIGTIRGGFERESILSRGGAGLRKGGIRALIPARGRSPVPLPDLRYESRN